MPDSMIPWLIGLSVFLAGLFVGASVWQLRRGAKLGGRRRRAAMAAAPADVAARRSPRPLNILLATDGSPCSEAAVEAVACRPWTPGTRVEILGVAHTRVPFIPDPTLGGAAAYVTAMEEERLEAPGRVRAAEARLAAVAGLHVETKVLEGPPDRTILEEAEAWKADLMVVGSHGRGAVGRRVLGSVSKAVALHAPCSVEIVRCSHRKSGAPASGARVA